MKLKLSFCKSGSPYFGPALELARCCPGFQEELVPYPAYSATFDTENGSDMERAFRLWHLIRCWRPSYATLDGMMLDGWKLERALMACQQKPARLALTLCFGCYWNGLPECFEKVVRGECPQKERFKLRGEIDVFLKQFEKNLPPEELKGLLGDD